MKKFLTLIILISSLKAAAQPSRGYIRYDTIYITGQTYVKNATGYRTGAALKNGGNGGLLLFQNVVDSMYTVNDSTLRAIIGGVSYNLILRGGLSPSNLNITYSTTTATVSNTNGTGLTINVADATHGGLMSAAMYNSLALKIQTVATTKSVTGDGVNTSIALVNDVTTPAASQYYGTNASGVKGYYDLTGGGGGSSNTVLTTLADLDASGSLATDKVYFITDTLRKGYFSYRGTTTNQNLDNGGTVIVNSALQVWEREFTGPLIGQWFGIKRGSSAYATANSVALKKLMNTTAQNWQEVFIPAEGGDLWLDSTITLSSVFTKHRWLTINGDIRSTSDTAFIMDGIYKQRLWINGHLYGPNTPLTVHGTTISDSTAYAAYHGIGVYLRNTYDNELYINEVSEYRVAIQQSGDAAGTTASGTQYNYVKWVQLSHNWCQIRISTIGTPSPALKGNFTNHTIWEGGLLGRAGVPGTTYGFGGWYGLIITKEPSSNAPYYGVTGHIFNHLNIEGTEHAIVMDNTAFIIFNELHTEELGNRYHYDLDSTCIDTKFVGGTWIKDNYFVAGRRGARTVIDEAVYGATNGNTSTQYMAQHGSTIPDVPSMAGVVSNGRFLWRSDGYPGFTALNSLDDTTGWFQWFVAPRPLSENGGNKIGGIQRSGMYKPTFRDVTSATPDLTTLPANIGYVRFSKTVAISLRIYAGDLTSIQFEPFIVEYNSATGGLLTFLNSANDATLIAASNFPATGKYMCVYRSGSYVVWRIDGSSGPGGGVTSVTATGAAASSDGGLVSGSVLTMYYANQSFPGLLSAVSQQIGGDKSFQGAINLRAGSATAYALKWPVSATLMTSPGTGTEQFDGLNRYITTSANQYERYLTDKNTAIIGGNKTYQGNVIGVSFGGTGGSTPQQARDNVLGDAYNVYSAAIETTNNTFTNALVTGLVNNTSGYLEYIITGYNESSIDRYTRKMAVSYKKVSGVLTIGTVTNPYAANSDVSMVSCDAQAVVNTSIVSDNNIGLQVKGLTGQTIMWKVTATLVYASPVFLP